MAGLGLLLAGLIAQNGAASTAPSARAPLAGADPARLCEMAVATAASKVGVPARLLHAVALTESGLGHDGQLRPWPWAINLAGQGHWFASRTEAETFVARQIALGITSIDIGCMQINLHWHGEAFADVAQILDPSANAIYAARFLAQLKAELGTWEAAAGAYHSRTPELAEQYLARVRRHLDGPDGGATAALGSSGDAAAPGAAPALPSPVAPPAQPARPRKPYPLLQPGQGAALGSLVPVTTTRAATPLLDNRSGGL